MIFYTPYNLKNILTHFELFIGILNFLTNFDKKGFALSKNFKMQYKAPRKELLLDIKKKLSVNTVFFYEDLKFEF